MSARKQKEKPRITQPQINTLSPLQLPTSSREILKFPQPSSGVQSNKRPTISSVVQAGEKLKGPEIHFSSVNLSFCICKVGLR